MNQFPQAPEYTIRAFSTRVFDTGGKWKKSSIMRVLFILFGHLWEVELTYKYNFVPSSSLSGLSSLILFPFATCVELTPVANLPPVTLIPLKKIEMVLMGYSGTEGEGWGGELIHEKNQKQKIL